MSLWFYYLHFPVGYGRRNDMTVNVTFDSFSVNNYSSVCLLYIEHIILYTLYKAQEVGIVGK